MRLLLITLSLLLFSIGHTQEQEELSEAELWLVLKENNKKFDAIHKQMKGSYRQLYSIKKDSLNPVDTLLNIHEFNKELKLKLKHQLHNRIGFNRKGKYEQLYKFDDYSETLKGRTILINEESKTDVFLRIAVVLHEKGISQTKFHQYIEELDILVLKEINTDNYHYFQKE